MIGASLYHYGARHEMYQKKYWDPIIIKDPHLLITLGGMGFIFSIGFASFLLPRVCISIALINFLLILLYGKMLDRFFFSKNFTIALVCITLLLLGFFSGHRLHPILPPILWTAFLFYLSREFLKDIEDFDANRLSERFTVPIVFGRAVTMKVAGFCLLAAASCLLRAGRYIPPDSVIAMGFVVVALGLFITWGLWLLLRTPRQVVPYAKFKILDLSSWSVILALLSMRAGI